MNCIRCGRRARASDTNTHCTVCSRIRFRESTERNAHKPCTKCGVGKRVKHKTTCADCYRNAALVRKYGVTLAEYETMLADQNGVCAICETTNDTVRPLAVDHDHTTGKVRGLLCDRCNPGIGYFRDKIDVLRKAITYLEEA